MTENKDPKQTVVVVDDDDIVLTSIESFLMLETNYNVVSFLSAEKALDFIINNDIDLVISDYLMPEMDGITFLARVRDERPEIPRIILTGYADKENAIKAINEVGLFQYIEKPWDNDDLIRIIRKGLDKLSLVKKLTEKIEQINKAYGELANIQKEIVRTFV